MDKELRRCSICDYFEGGEEYDRRRFVFDTPTQEHHCAKCMTVIRDDVGYNYWDNQSAAQERGRLNALRLRQGGRDFRGYDPTLDLVDRPGAPSGADLEAIEELWEGILQELDLGTLEDIE